MLGKGRGTENQTLTPKEEANVQLQLVSNQSCIIYKQKYMPSILLMGKTEYQCVSICQRISSHDTKKYLCPSNKK